jgi:osmotically-inducible protein OsmY
MSKNPRNRSAESDYDQTTRRRREYGSDYSDTGSYDSGYGNQGRYDRGEYGQGGQNTYRNPESYNEDYRGGNYDEYENRRTGNYDERDYTRSENQPMRDAGNYSSQQRGTRGSYGNSLRESFNDRYRPSNHFTEFDTENYRRSDSDRFLDRSNQWGEGTYSNKGEFRGKGPKGYKRSDDRIREDVNDTLTDNGMVDASDIEVSVENSEVTLTGTVRSKRDKRMAEDLAESVSGVSNIENRLRVKQSSEEADEEFTTKGAVSERSKKRQANQTWN